jgi:two-component system response regulator
MTSSAVLATADVLLVEDDPRDLLLTREAFEDHHLGLHLHVVGDGETAMRFLRRTGDFAGMARPALVLPGLNLPRRSGLEVLGKLKTDPGLHTIPVVVLTTSPAQADISRSYQRPVWPEGVLRFDFEPELCVPVNACPRVSYVQDRGDTLHRSP